MVDVEDYSKDCDDEDCTEDESFDDTYEPYNNIYIQDTNKLTSDDKLLLAVITIILTFATSGIIFMLL